MKILTTLSYYRPNISGITQYADQLAQILSQKYQVTILASQHQKTLPRREIINRRLTVYRAAVWKRLNKGLFMPTYPIWAWRLVRRNQLIILHAPQPEGFWVALFAWLFHRPLIVIHHCDFTFPSPWLNASLGLLVRLLHHFIYTWATAIVIYTLDYGQSSPLTRKRILKTEVILPPIKLPQNRKATRLPTAQIKIGFVGRLGWEKGLPVLLKAIPLLARQLNDFKIILIGPRPVGDASFQKIKPLLKKYRRHLHLVGPVTHQKLGAYYRQFSCLVLPSTSSLESFGIVQAEAMVSGCPVVVSNLPGVRVPVQMTGMGELAAPGNSSDLAAKILQVVQNHSHYQRQRLAQQIFNLQDFTVAWQQLIANTVGATKAGGGKR